MAQIPAITYYEAGGKIAFACLKHNFQSFALYFGVVPEKSLPVCPECIQEFFLKQGMAMAVVEPPKASEPKPEEKRPELTIAESPSAND
jgi:hypothetical protein